MTASQPVLVPLTAEARDAVNRDLIVMDRLPFRVGRECRVGVVHGRFASLDRRKTESPSNNDLYLQDKGSWLNVSREHFQIEMTMEGVFELVDRGSACGTSVDDEHIGGDDRGGRLALQDGSIIRVGGPRSHFLFRFFCGTGAPPHLG